MLWKHIGVRGGVRNKVFYSQIVLLSFPWKHASLTLQKTLCWAGRTGSDSGVFLSLQARDTRRLSAKSRRLGVWSCLPVSNRKVDRFNTTSTSIKVFVVLEQKAAAGKEHPHWDVLGSHSISTPEPTVGRSSFHPGAERFSWKQHKSLCNESGRVWEQSPHLPASLWMASPFPRSEPLCWGHLPFHLWPHQSLQPQGLQGGRCFRQGVSDTLLGTGQTRHWRNNEWRTVDEKEQWNKWWWQQ